MSIIPITLHETLKITIYSILQKIRLSFITYAVLASNSFALCSQLFLLCFNFFIVMSYVLIFLRDSFNHTPLFLIRFPSNSSTISSKLHTGFACKISMASNLYSCSISIIKYCCLFKSYTFPRTYFIPNHHLNVGLE